MADTAGAQDEEANGTVEKAQAHLPSVQEPAGRAGDRRNQSDPTRMGELLRGRTLEPVLLVHQAMGGEEGSAASDACPGTTGIRLEAVEREMAARQARHLQWVPSKS